MQIEPFVDQAKVLSKGQITIPKDVREALGVNRGDRIYFLVDGKSVRIVNSAVYALHVIQKEMEGEAERVGLGSEESIVDYVKSIRRKIVAEKNRESID